MINRLRSADQISFTAGADLAAGSLLKVGVHLVVILASVLTGETAVGYRLGVYSGLPKATGEVWAQGDALYWNTTSSKLTKTATSAFLCGVADEAAATGDTTGTAMLTGEILIVTPT